MSDIPPAKVGAERPRVREMRPNMCNKKKEKRKGPSHLEEEKLKSDLEVENKKQSCFQVYICKGNGPLADFPLFLFRLTFHEHASFRKLSCLPVLLPLIPRIDEQMLQRTTDAHLRRLTSPCLRSTRTHPIKECILIGSPNNCVSRDHRIGKVIDLFFLLLIID